MEVDTGASVSMSETTYYKLWPRTDLSTTTIRLQTYSKEPIVVVGSAQMRKWSMKVRQLQYVCKGDGPLLGTG